VKALLNEGLEKPLTIHDWPEDPIWFARLRQKIGEILDNNKK
jgi:hypothetical protein